MGNRKEVSFDEQVLRLPPHSAEAEKAVIGSMLIDRDAIEKVIEHNIEPADFFIDNHRRIFEVILDIYNRHDPVEIISVSEHIKTDKTLSSDMASTTAFLLSLHNSVTTSANVEYYAQVVKEKSTLRKIIYVGTDLADRAYRSEESADHILDKSEQEVLDIRARKKSDFIHVKDLVQSQLDRLEKASLNKKEVTGLATGIVDFDVMTCGLQPGNLVIIAGRPSMGKTAFAVNIAEHVAIELKKAVAIFSLEMSKEELMLRMLCSRARIDMQKAKKGYLEKKGWPVLTTVGEIISEAPLYIDDASSGEILELKSRARKLKKNLDRSGKELSLIIVDYLQLMHSASRSDSRQQEIAEISRSLKRLSMDLNVPVIAVSQLSRRPEEKGREKRPQLSDLRESGAIEQDADLVAGIYREEYYKTDKGSLSDEEKVAAEIIIMKQRNGPTGTIKACFLREYARFDNPDRKHADI
ncbi:MAG: replicative DNA helicase [Endomicrobiia bacterium]|nr:replicative DNA helicase [Endomicrobiia bacterium]